MAFRNSTKHADSGNVQCSAMLTEEAAEWLATLSDPACTNEERQQFAAWLRRSNLHVEEFLQVSVLSRRLGNAAAWGDATAADLIEQARTSPPRVTSLNNAPQPVPPRPANGYRRWMQAAAAALVVCLAAVAIALVANNFSAPSGATYATAVGEQRSVVLADGSIIELNTQSSVRTRFTAAERTVELLQGEAIFKVAKDAQRPFRVLSGSSQIVALGTAFNVYARSAGTVVTVIEGRVRVSRKDKGAAVGRSAALARASLSQSPEGSGRAYDIELVRGEQATIAPRQPIVRVTLSDPHKATAWTERRLIFEETPLSAVTAEFARYYTARTIRIADPTLAGLHITGVFDASDPASLVEFLKAFGAIDVREDERGWLIVGREGAQ